MLLHILMRRFSVIKAYSSPCRTYLTNTHKVNKNVLKRYFSSTVPRLSVYKLSSRGLLQVKGPDAVPFLQGLITSDVTLLGQEIKSQYSMLLNIQGRVVYDLILYDISNITGEPTILMECDKLLADKLLSEIRKYKIRKKVSLDDVSGTKSVLAAFQDDTEQLPWKHKTVTETSDPRVPAFGTRIITETETLDGCDVIADEAGYHERRLQWGIPEGSQDLPPGNCFPLESNLVFMNGVSFSKGCYLGQELTARTYHTGVTRKRLMPLVFQSPPADVEPGENIHNENNKSVGKYRSSYGVYGLGLMRTADVIGKLTDGNEQLPDVSGQLRSVSGPLQVKTKTGVLLPLTAGKPTWWPHES